jgi:predicted nucleotidyltransferase
MRRTGMKADHEIEILKKNLRELRDKGKVLIAVLFGSQANGDAHVRSDIDLGLYLPVMDQKEELQIIDRILMCSDLPVSILRLDDDDESPLIVQEALKGVHLVEPDTETLYAVYHRILHEGEAIRSRKELRLG